MSGTAIITLEYEGKSYTFREVWESFHTAQYNYEEGNWSCDCNRSMELFRFFGITDGDLPCGETIKLVSLTWEELPANERMPAKTEEKVDDEDRAKQNE